MKRYRHAFTLVELLIVIAIIGILMALLLPALKNVRDSATRSACASNIKQMLTAISNYAADNKDRLYNTLPGSGGAPGACHSAGNLNGLASPIRYLTTDLRFDPAQPKTLLLWHPTSQFSHYTVMPIGGASTSTATMSPRFSKFSEVPNDRAMVMDMLRLFSNSNHPVKGAGPFYNLGFVDGSVKTVQIPPTAYIHWKSLGNMGNAWHVHNDMIRVMELVAAGKDPSRVASTAMPWPWATSPNTSTHFYIPRYGGPTKGGKAHALSDD